MESVKVLLVRDEPSNPVEFDYSEESPLRSLAEDARDVLGYSVLETTASAVKVDERGELRKVLDALEITPYTKESVDAYQEQRKDAVNREALTEFLKNENAHNGFYGAHIWDTTEIKEYKQPIPEYVLNKAVQIKKAMPQVGIFIQHLKIDPFLLVQTPNSKGQCSRWEYGERYWIECWDEPKFEGHL